MLLISWLLKIFLPIKNNLQSVSNLSRVLKRERKRRESYLELMTGQKSTNIEWHGLDSIFSCSLFTIMLNLKTLKTLAC